MKTKMSRSKALQDELDTRIESIRTSDPDATESEAEVTALEDIVDMSADDYGANYPGETAGRLEWNRIRREARAETETRRSSEARASAAAESDDDDQDGGRDSDADGRL
jgi:hypothetical protein